MGKIVDQGVIDFDGKFLNTLIKVAVAFRTEIKLDTIDYILGVTTNFPHMGSLPPYIKEGRTTFSVDLEFANQKEGQPIDIKTEEFQKIVHALEKAFGKEMVTEISKGIDLGKITSTTYHIILFDGLPIDETKAAEQLHQRAVKLLIQY